MSLEHSRPGDVKGRYTATRGYLVSHSEPTYLCGLRRALEPFRLVKERTCWELVPLSRPGSVRDLGHLPAWVDHSERGLLLDRSRCGYPSTAALRCQNKIRHSNYDERRHIPRRVVAQLVRRFLSVNCGLEDASLDTRRSYAMLVLRWLIASQFAV